jgi:hypothetical protein
VQQRFFKLLWATGDHQQESKEGGNRFASQTYGLATKHALFVSECISCAVFCMCAHLHTLNICKSLWYGNTWFMRNSSSSLKSPGACPVAGCRPANARIVPSWRKIGGHFKNNEMQKLYR